MPDRIPHSRPTLPSAAEWAEVTGRLASGWVADGPCEEAFARQAAEWLGGVGGVAVNSGTSALHLALLAVGVRPGSEVLIPAYCCAALLNAVALAGAVPVLVDAEPGGFNLCAEDARRRLTSRAAAVVVAHLFGRPAPLAPFRELGVPIIEDCAQSLGAREDDTLTGSGGAVAICSFYATKVITTGQGGLVSTRDPEMLSMLRDLVDYDHRDDWRPRFNYRMGELPAALGLWQLERLPAFLERRSRIAAYYDEQLSGMDKALCGAWAEIASPDPALTPGPSPNTGRGGTDSPSLHTPLSRQFSGEGPGVRAPGAICYRYLLRVPEAEAVIAALQERGIDAKRPVYRPLHHDLGGEFPHAQAAHEQCVSLPIYPALTDEEIERVPAAVRAVMIRRH